MTQRSARSCARTARNSSLRTGSGFDVAEAQAWYDLMVKAQKAEGLWNARADQRGGRQAAGPEARSCSGRPPSVWLQLQSAGSDQQRGGGRLPDGDTAGPEPGRQGDRTEDLVQGEHAVVGVSQDQESGSRDRLDQLVRQRPGGCRHRQGRAGHPAELRDTGRRSRPSCSERNRWWRSTSPTSSPRWPPPRSPHPRAAAR